MHERPNFPAPKRSGRSVSSRSVSGGTIADAERALPRHRLPTQCIHARSTHDRASSDTPAEWHERCVFGNAGLEGRRAPCLYAPSRSSRNRHCGRAIRYSYLKDENAGFGVRKAWSKVDESYPMHDPAREPSRGFWCLRGQWARRQPRSRRGRGERCNRRRIPRTVGGRWRSNGGLQPEFPRRDGMHLFARPACPRLLYGSRVHAAHWCLRGWNSVVHSERRVRPVRPLCWGTATRQRAGALHGRDRQ